MEPRLFTAINATYFFDDEQAIGEDGDDNTGYTSGYDTDEIAITTLR